jgi:hypothetical protein
MPNEDEAKSAESQTLQDAARNLEEKIFDAKDATLRLWERNRHLQERVGGLESRVRLLTWLILGLGLVSAGVFAVLAKGQVSPLQNQVAGLQETIGTLQARVEASDRAIKAGANNSSSSLDETRIKQMERQMLDSVKNQVPDILASIIKEGGPGSPFTAVHGTIGSTTVREVKGPTGEPLRLVVGRTDPKKTSWVQYNDGGIYVDIDTSSAGFSATPYYFTSLSGHTNNWMAQGVTSIYLPTEKGFRVHVGHRELKAAQAKEWGWSVNWIAVGN